MVMGSYISKKPHFLHQLCKCINVELKYIFKYAIPCTLLLELFQNIGFVKLFRTFLMLCTLIAFQSTVRYLALRTCIGCLLFVTSKHKSFQKMYNEKA